MDRTFPKTGLNMQISLSHVLSGKAKRSICDRHTTQVGEFTKIIE